MSSSTKKGRHGLFKTPLSYGDQVLVGGIRGRVLGGGWVEGVVQKQHPSGRVTVRIHGRNHVVSGEEVLPKRFSFTLRLPAEVARPDGAAEPMTAEREPRSQERWWVDEDGITVRDENRLIVAVAAGPDDAELIARAPRMQHAIQRTLERLQHETGAPLGHVIAQLRAALFPVTEVGDPERAQGPARGVPGAGPAGTRSPVSAARIHATRNRT